MGDPFLRLLQGTAAILTGVVIYTGGDLAYTSYRDKGYDAILEQKFMQHGDANGDNFYTNDEREQFYRQFIKDNDLKAFQREDRVYDRQGERVTNKQLVDLINAYTPNQPTVLSNK